MDICNGWMRLQPNVTRLRCGEAALVAMESTRTSLLDVLLLVSLTAVTILLLWTWRRRPQGRRRLPPGPWGVPILGSLPFVNPELHRYFADITAKYGPVSSVRLGGKLYVVISSPSAAMEVLKVHDAVFASRPFFCSMNAFNDGIVDIVLSPNGPMWRLIRKVAVREVLSPTVIDSFQWLRRQVVGGMISDLKSKVGMEVNIRETLHSVTLDQMLRMIWEDALMEKGRGLTGELLQVVQAMMELMAAPNISDFLPILAPLDLQGVRKKMKALSARFKEIVDSIMGQRAPSGNHAAAKEGRVGDFVQLLVDLIDRKDPEMPLELDHARGIIFDLLSGGTDTSSTTVEWAMCELLRHPEIMARVRAELDSVVGRGCVLEEWHVPKLELLKAVLMESSRMHPILPMLIPRSPSTAAEIGGYSIPEGTAVFVHAWAIHRDPSVWEAPMEFRPERFLERKDHQDKPMRYSNGKSFEYLPFGSGRRICAGMNLGERTMLHLLASLLHAFEWRLPHGSTTVDAEEKYGTVVKRKEPLVLVPYATVISQ